MPTLDRTRWIAAFNRWFDAHQYYTGSNQPVIDKKQAAVMQVTLKAIEIGFTLLTGRIMSGAAYSPAEDLIKSALGGPALDLPQAKDLREAGAVLQAQGARFDFGGVRLSWDSPYVILGLFADAMDEAALERLVPEFSKIARALGGFGPSSAPIFARVFLLYEDSTRCARDAQRFNAPGFQVNKVNRVSLRTAFARMDTREISWANGSGLWSVLTKRERDNIFTPRNWEEVLAEYVTNR